MRRGGHLAVFPGQLEVGMPDTTDNNAAPAGGLLRSKKPIDAVRRRAGGDDTDAGND